MLLYGSMCDVIVGAMCDVIVWISVILLVMALFLKKNVYIKTCGRGTISINKLRKTIRLYSNNPNIILNTNVAIMREFKPLLEEYKRKLITSGRKDKLPP